jgi:four helix bundle protein
MSAIKRFEDIEAWQKGRELKQVIYRFTKSGELAKDFALRDQIRRAVISVTANIGEGFERGGNKEFIQFLSNAKGSCGEVRDHLYTALDESYVTKQEFQMAYDGALQVSRMISGLIDYLQRSPLRGHKSPIVVSGKVVGP